MQTLGAARLLSVWEQTLGQPTAWRAPVLLALMSGEPIEEIAQLSVGIRDSRLLMLREAIFGNSISATVHCSLCSETLELNFSVDDIRVGTPAISEQCNVLVEGYEVNFRLPNSLDLNAVADANSVTRAQQTLLERCLLNTSQDGEPLLPTQLPQSVVQAVSEQMAKADPQADIELALTCPNCGHVWQAQFDIALFFWTELNVWAQRILWEVHSLAHYYGWRECDILSMSSLRRQMYLQMAGAS